MQLNALKRMGVQWCQKVDHVDDHMEEVPIPMQELDSLAFHRRWEEWMQQGIHCAHQCLGNACMRWGKAERNHNLALTVCIALSMLHNRGT